MLTGGAALCPSQLRHLPEVSITLALSLCCLIYREDKPAGEGTQAPLMLLSAFVSGPGLHLVHLSLSAGGPLSRAPFKPLSLTSDSF